MTVAIKTEGLSKSYILQHQRGARYETFGELLMQSVPRLGERIRHPFSPTRYAAQKEEFWALQDINVEIQQGERIGIIGRNGAGKTTLLKLLSRITEPSKGRFTIDGRVSSLLEVGTGFHPELSGRENIYLNGAILGMPRAEIQRKFDEIVAFAEIDRFLDTPVKRYSSGMYVRLAFAVAAHLEPEILIVDEVLAVGDAAFQKKCLGKMNEVAGEGRTVLFVSHNLGAIRRLCSRCLLLDNGRLVADSSPADIMSRYTEMEASQSGSGQWRNEDTDSGGVARLVAVRCANSEGRTTDNFTWSDGIVIHAEIEVLKVSPELALAIRLTTHGGDILIHSADIAQEQVARTPGVWKVHCEIPAGLLNTGRYSISIGADVPFRESLFLINDAISFEVEPATEIWNRYSPEAWQGQLGPGAVHWGEWTPSLVRENLSGE